jgi:D-alanyl-D-alanine carboxypeptidase (penicillin-binding protein 5/6)
MLRLILTCIFSLVVTPVLAIDPASLPIPKPPAVGAKAYLLIDFNSGQILAEKAADARMEPASITKELAAGSLQLDDMVTISEKAWRTPGSRMFVQEGRQVSVQDLIQGIIVQSGNDATVALAEHVAGSEETFAAYMNRYAEELGLTDSHFTNSTGLPDQEHYTTAADIARLSRAVIREFPEYYKWYAEREFTYNDIKQHNRNKLLWRDESVDGIKTGHTESAGYCLVTSAVRDNMRLIAVVLGTTSEAARASASQALLNYGFRFFETHKLYDAGARLTDARVWKGTSDAVPLGLDNTLYITVPRGRYQALDASMEIQKTIIAPVTEGTSYGSVQVRLDGNLLADPPLVALQPVAEGSFWQRIVDEAMLYLE